MQGQYWSRHIKHQNALISNPHDEDLSNLSKCAGPAYIATPQYLIYPSPPMAY